MWQMVFEERQITVIWLQFLAANLCVLCRIFQGAEGGRATIPSENGKGNNQKLWKRVPHLKKNNLAQTQLIKNVLGFHRIFNSSPNKQFFPGDWCSIAGFNSRFKSAWERHRFCQTTSVSGNLLANLQDFGIEYATLLVLKERASSRCCPLTTSRTHTNVSPLTPHSSPACLGQTLKGTDKDHENSNACSHIAGIDSAYIIRMWVSVWNTRWIPCENAWCSTRRITRQISWRGSRWSSWRLRTPRA